MGIAEWWSVGDECGVGPCRWVDVEDSVDVEDEGSGQRTPAGDVADPQVEGPLTFGEPLGSNRFQRFPLFIGVRRTDVLNLAGPTA